MKKTKKIMVVVGTLVVIASAVLLSGPCFLTSNPPAAGADTDVGTDTDALPPSADETGAE